MADLMPIDPEIRELLKAAVQCPFHGDEKRFENIAGKIADWNSVIACARQHRIAPLLYARLIETDAPVPPVIQQLLRTEYDRNAFRSVANATELARQLRLEPGWVAEVLRLTRLAPDIVQAILDGRQPRHLNLHAVRGLQAEVPVAWEEQRVLFGFEQ